MMGKDDILAILRDYKRQAAAKFGILDLGIFGSAARDEAREGSDLDICIRTATPDPFILVHIKEDLENLLSQRVDIVRVRDAMNPFLKKRIEEEGIYV